MRPRRPVSLMKKRVLLEVTSPNSSGPGGARPSSPPGSTRLRLRLLLARVQADRGASAPIPPPPQDPPPPPASGFGLLPGLEVRGAPGLAFLSARRSLPLILGETVLCLKLSQKLRHTTLGFQALRSHYSLLRNRKK